MSYRTKGDQLIAAFEFNTKHVRRVEIRYHFDEWEGYGVILTWMQGQRRPKHRICSEYDIDSEVIGYNRMFDAIVTRDIDKLPLS